MIQRRFLIIGSLMAIVAVTLGAFGAHGLKPNLTESQISTFEIGIRYHFYHTFGILIIALLADKLPAKRLNTIGWLFTVGIILFSGSLYLLATKDLIGVTWSFLGPLTPIGGTLFIIGWAILLLEAIKKK